jgi:hypothetical protein
MLGFQSSNRESERERLSRVLEEAKRKQKEDAKDLGWNHWLVTNHHGKNIKNLEEALKGLEMKS